MFDNNGSNNTNNDSDKDNSKIIIILFGVYWFFSYIAEDSSRYWAVADSTSITYSNRLNRLIINRTIIILIIIRSIILILSLLYIINISLIISIFNGIIIYYQ